MIGGTVNSKIGRAIVAFLGASFSASALVFPSLIDSLSRSADLSARNLESLGSLGFGELLPWLVVLLLTVVVVSRQTERNPIVLSVLAMGVPTIVAGLGGVIVHVVQ